VVNPGAFENSRRQSVNPEITLPMKFVARASAALSLALRCRQNSMWRSPQSLSEARRCESKSSCHILQRENAFPIHSGLSLRARRRIVAPPRTHATPYPILPPAVFEDFHHHYSSRHAVGSPCRPARGPGNKLQTSATRMEQRQRAKKSHRVGIPPPKQHPLDHDADQSARH